MNELTDPQQAIARRLLLRLVSFGEGRPKSRLRLAQQAAPPSDDAEPEAEPELFVFDGRSRHGAEMIAARRGFVRDDSAARVWDAATGKPVTRSLEHQAAVTAQGGPRLDCARDALRQRDAGCVRPKMRSDWHRRHRRFRACQSLARCTGSSGMWRDAAGRPKT
jgi:hypothetical protein